jgi:hypothetical protein
MSFELFYAVTPGSCWYSTVNRAVPLIRGKRSRYKLPGPCGLLQSPGSEYVARVLIFRRSALAGSPKNFHWGPNPLSAALSRGLQIFKKSNSHLEIMSSRKVT